MAKMLIEDKEQFFAFLAQQPLCVWSSRKQHELAAGMHTDKKKSQHAAQSNTDNADLAAALSSMA